MVNNTLIFLRSLESQTSQNVYDKILDYIPNAAEEDLDILYNPISDSLSGIEMVAIEGLEIHR